jgi:hypothetical protein
MRKESSGSRGVEEGSRGDWGLSVVRRCVQVCQSDLSTVNIEVDVEREESVYDLLANSSPQFQYSNAEHKVLIIL